MEPAGRGIDERVRRLYGEVDWSCARGRLHVAAIHGPTRNVIAIGPAAPASATDRFALGLARARASLIVTTGSILRAEPDLVHRYAEDPDEEAGLRRFRAERVGIEPPPRLLVLSGRADFAPDHPALVGASGWIWTTSEGRDRLAPGVPGFEVVVGEDPGFAAAITFVERDPSIHTLLVEAGPSTSGALYEGEAVPVDELLLSCFEGRLAPTATASPFVSTQRVGRCLGPPVTSLEREEASGAWRFERYLRRPENSRRR